MSDFTSRSRDLAGEPHQGSAGTSAGNGKPDDKNRYVHCTIGSGSALIGSKEADLDSGQVVLYSRSEW